jgi:hypothetical protein
MRKIKNPQPASSDPSLLFARGVEQLLGDSLHRPASKDTQYLRRRAPSGKTENAAVAVNFFSAFLRQYLI